MSGDKPTLEPLAEQTGAGGEPPSASSEHTFSLGDIHSDVLIDALPPSSEISAGDEADQDGQRELLRRMAARYVLLEELGRGGEGIVYRARDTGAKNMIVAIKVGRNRLIDGFVGARDISHQYVCGVHHADSWRSTCIVIMTFVDGPNLSKLLRELSRAAALRLFRRICEGVAAIHAAGIVHLDLKPSNILVEGDVPRINDFGLALPAGTTSPAGRGTRGFMAPEQATGGVVQPHTDVFALGRILEEMIPKPGFQLSRVIRRATSVDPRARYQSVSELLEALETVRYLRLILWLALALVVTASLLLAFPPKGRRVPFRTELWGPDPLPVNVWNVARDAIVTSSHDPVGCARQVSDLVDGAAEYQQWEHGYAFPGVKGICVTLDVLGYCGALREERQLCSMGADRPVEKLALTVGQRASADPGVGRQLGQLEPGSSCEQDYALTLTLERSYDVSAVRAWFRQGAPTRLGVAVSEDGSNWQTMVETTQNEQWTKREMMLPADRHGSVPVTIDFRPVAARHVRLTTRCDMQNPAFPSKAGDPVWLFEFEVGAQLRPWQAWLRLLGLG